MRVLLSLVALGGITASFFRGYHQNANANASTIPLYRADYLAAGHALFSFVLLGAALLQDLGAQPGPDLGGYLALFFASSLAVGYGPRAKWSALTSSAFLALVAFYIVPESRLDTWRSVIMTGAFIQLTAAAAVAALHAYGKHKWTSVELPSWLGFNSL